MTKAIIPPITSSQPLANLKVSITISSVKSKPEQKSEFNFLFERFIFLLAARISTLIL